jgi:hypothetical protein
MVVTFYKTKLNKQNRCYGAEQYDSYLSTCEKLDVTLSHDIIPNQPFNIETTSGMWGYNYITYAYRGYLFGAFVDSINIQAISGTTVIYHSTDNWYFTLNNIGVNNIDFHGRVMRGHVRDTDKGHKPILDNTTLTAEEVFNNSNLKYVSVDNMFNLSVYDTAKCFKECWFLYIYFANPSKVMNLGGVTAINQKFTGNNGSVLGNNGVTCVYPVVADKTGWWVCELVDNKLEQSVAISALTNSDITAMTLSKIPPNNKLKFYEDSTSPSGYRLSGITTGLNWKENTTNLPMKCCYYDFEFVNIEVNRLYSEGKRVDISSLEGNSISNTDNYDDYLKQIPKFTSLVYNPLYVGKNIYDLYHKEDGNIFAGISISFDLSTYLIYRNLTTINGDSKIVVLENNSIFAPDTVLDYWTRLNSLQTANAGKMQENSGISQGVNNIGSIIKKATGIVSSIGNVIGAAFEGDINGVVGGVSGFINSGTDTITSAINMQRSQENADLTSENGAIIQEVANRQIETGTTVSQNGVGYYTNYKYQSFIYLIDNSYNYKQICTNLHRYGYNTFLQLDDVYFNHVREHFNYIKCSEVEVTGVPADIADDISNMFLKGVHLWQDDVENFERTNYSKGEWNV